MGFASALIAVPLLSLRLPLVVVVPVVSLLDYAASVTHGLQCRRSIRWRDLWPLAPFTAAEVVVGLPLLAGLRQGVLATLLGVFIGGGYGIYTLLPLPAWVGDRRWAGPTGFLGGLVGTIFGTGGPFYVAIFACVRSKKVSSGPQWPPSSWRTVPCAWWAIWRPAFTPARQSG
ncbi:MAG: TSUP family transporter [Deltaproteobacteria bacterium]